VQISSRNEAVKGLVFQNNKNIFYLPENVAEKFPNLFEYAALNCSIENVLRQHFSGLKRLRLIDLGYNQIEEMAVETFIGLVSVEEIILREKFQSQMYFLLKLIFFPDFNRIKFLDSKTFQKLQGLTKVALKGNYCINRDFTDPIQIKNIEPALSEKCNFKDPNQITRIVVIIFVLFAGILSFSIGIFSLLIWKYFCRQITFATVGINTVASP
jgi:hypothetical protein